MASLSNATARLPRLRHLNLLLIAVVASVLLVACDDDDAANGDGSPSPTATSTQTGTGTSTPGGGMGGGGTGSADYDAAYGSALEMALDEDRGSEVDDAYLASVDIDIRPDGHGLPDGSGIATQGAAVYAAQCASCHGDNGEGGGPAGNGPQVIIDPATAQDGWQPDEPKVIGNYWPYATTVYDYVRRAMPFLTPGSLTDDEYYAVVAFLLAENGIIGEEEEMNAETLPQVEMPNRDHFFSCWPDECRPDVESGG